MVKSKKGNAEAQPVERTIMQVHPFLTNREMFVIPRPQITLTDQNTYIL